MRPTLDVEYAHAIAPGANILLVETPVVGDRRRHRLPADRRGRELRDQPSPRRRDQPELQRHRADVPDKATLDSLRGAYVNAAGARRHRAGRHRRLGRGRRRTQRRRPTTCTRSTTWPPTDPLVTAVGGTQLHLNASGTHLAGHRLERHLQHADAAVHLRRRRPEPAGRRRRQVRLLLPAVLPGRRAEASSGNSRGVPDISMSAACNGARRHLPQLRRHPGGLVPDLRHQRGHPAVLRHRGAGRPGRRSLARADQPGAVPAVGRARAGHRGRHLGQQHRVVHPERHRPTP